MERNTTIPCTTKSKPKRKSRPLTVLEKNERAERAKYAEESKQRQTEANKRELALPETEQTSIERYAKKRD